MYLISVTLYVDNMPKIVELRFVNACIIIGYIMFFEASGMMVGTQPAL